MQSLIKKVLLLKQQIYNTCVWTASYRMANSRFEYVKNFELPDKILPNTWIVIRIDGKGFTKFTDDHKFEKPNDIRGLSLMNEAATSVMNKFSDIIIGFGHSDEYSFVIRKSTNLFNRRSAKLLSCITSLFSSSYVFHWKKWFEEEEMQYPPCFDGRIVLYPTDENLKDYLRWRQADVHINNLYNTIFWCLVLKDNLTRSEAEVRLRGTLSAEKNELLFSKFGINYNNLPNIFRKGTTLLRKRKEETNEKSKHHVIALHEDIMQNKFWKDHPEFFGTSSSDT